MRPELRLIHNLPHRLWITWWRSSGQELFEVGEQLALSLGTDDPPLRQSVLEDDVRGDAHDVEPACGIGVLVEILRRLGMAFVVVRAQERHAES